MEDKYKNFQELAAAETEGTDYEIELQDRGTDVAVIGIHGGEIEPDTEAVVRAIAEPDLSYYLFLGNAERLHLTSHLFDEPQCIQLISGSKTVVSIHGKSGSGEFVMLGGLDDELVVATATAFVEAGFEVDTASANVIGRQPLNVCNRGTSGKGLQVEMSRELRKSLAQDSQRMAAFARAIRTALH